MAILTAGVVAAACLASYLAEKGVEVVDVSELRQQNFSQEFRIADSIDLDAQYYGCVKSRFTGKCKRKQAYVSTIQGFKVTDNAHEIGSWSAWLEEASIRNLQAKAASTLGSLLLNQYG